MDTAKHKQAQIIHTVLYDNGIWYTSMLYYYDNDIKIK